MAVSRDDILKLAKLSRLELKDEEVMKLLGEINSIVSYVDVIQEVKLPEKPDASPYLELENSMRSDDSPHETGKYTKDIVDQFSEKEGNYLKVKKILP